MHPKLVRAGLAGFGLFVAGLCYANHYLTDGFIHAKALPAVFPGERPNRLMTLVSALVAAGLWETRDEGWQVHDFNHYQPTSVEVRTERVRVHEAKVRAGRLGGIAKAAHSRHIAEDIAKGVAQGVAKCSPVPVPVPVPVENLTTLSGKNPTPHSQNGMPGRELRENAKAILSFLNEKTGRAYRPVETNLRLIEARLKSGASVQDCKSVCARKCRQWLTDPKMAEFLRPATLFAASKFEQYLGEMEPTDG